MVDKTNEILEKRLDTNETITEEMYIDGLFDITQFLCGSLGYLLEQENRLFGITVSYMNSIDDAFSRFNTIFDIPDCDIFGKILYLYKPILVHEYKHLIKKHVSPADADIVLLKRILEIIMSFNKIYNHRHYREIRTVNKIITKLYDNIRNNNKTCAMLDMVEKIKTYKEMGIIGRYVLDEFCIADFIKDKDKTILEGSGIRLYSGQKTTTEVIWKDE